LAVSDDSNTGEPPAVGGAQGDPAVDVAAPPHRLHGARRFGLFVLAFGSGFAVLTIEIAGARLIAPVFGLSAVPWTAVIGVILAALAVGSHLGGRLADQGRIPLAWVLVAAALTAALPVVGAGIPWMARGVLGFIPGALASALILFAPAVLCLGAVVPYLVQADTESLGNVGRRAGDVTAAATAGSIAGTFMTGFILLPAFSLPVLLGLTAAGLLVMAGLSGWILGKRVPTGFIALGVIALGTLGVASAQRPADTLHQEQTLHASVKVTERDWGDGRLVRELWQNGSSSSAEYVDTGSPAHRYVDASGLILEPVMDDVESMLVLGGAALSLPVAFSRWKPEMRIDVVEIDPVVTELAAEYFAYGKADYPNIHVVHEDARVYVRDSEDLYDLIYLDVFEHLLTIPWTMVTVEAFTEFADRLEPGGLLVANVLSPLSGPGVGFLQRLRATAVEVFEEVQVYVTDSEVDRAAIQNLIVVASRDASAVPKLEWPVAGPGAAGRPLRDAWAPVEYLQARVFLEGVRWN
jgi:predicted membrane-bound spermidine synthase